MLTYRYCKYGKDKKLSLEIGANRELFVDFSATQPKYIILSDGQIRVSYNSFFFFFIFLCVSRCNFGSKILKRTRLLFQEMPWRGAGVALPMFSMRSEADLGVGEFLDLKLLVDWAVDSGFHLVQLLPINDTSVHGMWWDSYPYR